MESLSESVKKEKLKERAVGKKRTYLFFIIEGSEIVRRNGSNLLLYVAITL